MGTPCADIAIAGVRALAFACQHGNSELRQARDVIEPTDEGFVAAKGITRYTQIKRRCTDALFRRSRSAARCLLNYRLRSLNCVRIRGNRNMMMRQPAHPTHDGPGHRRSLLRSLVNA